MGDGAPCGGGEMSAARDVLLPDPRIDDARAYIAKTLDNVNGMSFEWRNDEVVSLLLDVMSLLEGRDIR